MIEVFSFYGNAHIPSQRYMPESIYLTFDIVLHLGPSGTWRKIKSNKLQSDIENSFANDTQTSQEFTVMCVSMQRFSTLFKVYMVS